jgi:hypothetical protein
MPRQRLADGSFVWPRRSASTFRLPSLLGAICLHLLAAIHYATLPHDASSCVQA